MNTLTLPTGRVIRLEHIEFDRATQRFYYGTLDVTPYLTRAQMLATAGDAFDVERANREASDAARIGRGEAPYADPPSTSTLGLWVDNVSADVATAAQGVRDFVGIGPENAGKRSPLFWTALVLGAGFLAYQLGLFVWIRKKLTA